MAYTAYERETVVTTSDAEDVVHIWTYQRRYITRLLRNKRVTVVDYDEENSELHCTVPSQDWNPATGIKRQVNMTDEQKKASALRLHKLRESKNGETK